MLSLSHTEILLARAGSPLDEITLVGGQALNYWANAFFAPKDPYVSKDIDFLGSAVDAIECATAWNARTPLLADIDRSMGSPNTALVLIENPRHFFKDPRLEDKPLPIDFLGGILGLSTTEILKSRVKVQHGRAEFWVMNPYHCLISRLSTYYVLGRQNETDIERLRLAVHVVGAALQKFLEGEASGRRAALNIAKDLFSDAKQSPALRAFTKHGVDILTPILNNLVGYPDDFRVKHYPRELLKIDNKRNLYRQLTQAPPPPER